jgi:hypothetical protein
MQVCESETPTTCLTPSVLADDPIQLGLNATGEPELCPVDRPHESLINDAGVDPVG